MTKKVWTKNQTLTSFKLRLNFEFKTETFSISLFLLQQIITPQPNKNISGTLAEYLDNSNWNFSNFQNLNSCGHLTEQLVGEIQEN
jgi:hypothetical protein